MKVNIYERTTSDNRTSLSLDYYVNGKRIRKALGLFFYTKPNSTSERNHNKETKIMLDTIKAEKTLQIQKGEHGLTDNRSKYKDFIGYFKSLVLKREETGVNYDAWKTTQKHLLDYCQEGISFNSVSTEWIDGFRDYLQFTKKLKSASVMQYFSLLKHAIHDAFRAKLIKEDFAYHSKGIKVENSERQYLSMEELVSLTTAHCNIDSIKRAFLFSAITGIAFADIKKMTWGQLRFENNQWSVNFHRKKTKGLQYHPITKEARELLGEEGELEEKVFRKLNYNTWGNIELKKWIVNAGITKEITFHCARHTYATQMLRKGVPITTVKEMMGHKDLKTTMIYAKIVDADKVNAANLMTLKAPRKKKRAGS